MKLPKKITIKICEDGNVEMDYNGFKGTECTASHERILTRMQKMGVDLDVGSTVSTPKQNEGFCQKNKESW